MVSIAAYIMKFRNSFLFITFCFITSSNDQFTKFKFINDILCMNSFDWASVCWVVLQCLQCDNSVDDTLVMFRCYIRCKLCYIVVRYVEAKKDRVTVIFSTVFRDSDDIIIGKVFMQVIILACYIYILQVRPIIVTITMDASLFLLEDWWMLPKH